MQNTPLINYKELRKISPETARQGNLPKTQKTETQKIKQFLAQLDKVLAIADSLKKVAQEAIKSEILR
uniref:Uncharacterized protein n=1 Tax=candidate division WOR-3 bacterium TaxID=2052148 RepID=A0A7C6AAQ2_UNCW3